MRTIIAVTFACAIAHGAELSKDEVLKKAHEAMGGAARIAQVQSVAIHAKIDGAQLNVLVKRPAMIRVQIDTGQGQVIQAYDGQQGWMQLPGQPAKELTGAELDRMKDQAAAGIGGPLAEPEKRGIKVNNVERAEVAGKHAYIVNLTTSTGMVMALTLDPDTFLETHEVLQPKGDGTIEEDVGDYRDVNGLKLPFQYVSWEKSSPEKHTLAVQSIELNAPANDSDFKLPK